MRLLPILLVTAALHPFPSPPGTLEQPLPGLIPPFSPGRLTALTPDLERRVGQQQRVGQEQRVEQEQRSMSPEESLALHQWARRHLEEMEARSEGGSHPFPTEMERLRAMYFLSVEDRSWVVKATDLLETLEEMLAPGAPQGVTLEAYRGALEAVQAKHARWPPTKLRHLREGVGTLDRLVEDEPGNLEVRYLRLVSCYYLPFFLKREESVREDLQVLVANLPHHPEAFSPPVYRGVVEFVLDKGDPDEGERALLQEALRSSLEQRSTPGRPGSTPPGSRQEDLLFQEAPGHGGDGRR
jgi:hypothetical protein